MNIEESELKQLQEQENKKSTIFRELGILETQKHSILHLYAEVMELQEITKEALEEKYGKININLQDGTYEPIEE
jgi:hypothetical protein